MVVMEQTIALKKNRRFNTFEINKSFITNFISLTIIGCGYLSPYYREQILTIGYFSFSGALTNWLAVHMLFEKVPGLYGSGVVPNNFSEFKRGINSLIMRQFFTQENIERFFLKKQGGADDIFSSRDSSTIIDRVLNYDQLFKRLLESIKESPFGSMLALIGGVEALTPIKEPFVRRMREVVNEIAAGEDFKEAINSYVRDSLSSSRIIDKVNYIVKMRLDELTPYVVKEIVQEMIKKHLGWLVVWGGIFGGVIGLIAAFLIK